MLESIDKLHKAYCGFLTLNNYTSFQRKVPLEKFSRGMYPLISELLFHHSITKRYIANDTTELFSS